jgi:hypothetical protein
MLSNNKGVFMIKKAFKYNGTFGWIAIIAIVVVIGLSMVGCGDDDGGNPVNTGGNGSGNKVIITEVPANLIDVAGGIYIGSTTNNTIARGSATISGNSIIYEPYDPNGTYPYPPWTGRGPYYITILLGDYYYYKNGTATQQTYNFSSATSTIPFSKFAR